MWTELAIGLIVGGACVIAEALLDEWRDRRKKPERKETSKILREVLLVVKRKP